MIYINFNAIITSLIQIKNKSYESGICTVTFEQMFFFSKRRLHVTDTTNAENNIGPN